MASRTATIVLLAVSVSALTGCTMPGSGPRSAGTTESLETLDRLPSLRSAPEYLRNAPVWVSVDKAVVLPTVRFDESDKKVSSQDLENFLRQEVIDQIVQTEHFRYYPETGTAKSVQPVYRVKATLRRFDVGPELTTDSTGAGHLSSEGSKIRQVERRRPITCDVRLELIATDHTDPRVGLPGETLAVGDGAFDYDVVSERALLTESGAPDKPADAKTSERAQAAFPIQREQIPGAFRYGVRRALNSLLTEADTSVFERERKAIDADKQEERRKSQEAERKAEEARKHEKEAQDAAKQQPDSAKQPDGTPKQPEGISK